MKLTFLGGTKSVTGANYLLETKKTKILIDCGLFQSCDYCDESNFLPFRFRPDEIHALIVTHAHIDHIGRIPYLVKNGFMGAILSTPPTRDFAELLLLDSEKVLRDEAEKKKREPLYEIRDVERAMSIWGVVPYHTETKIGDFSITFFDAGHVLGSSFVVVEGEGKKVVFSGDLGNTNTPFINQTDQLGEADYVLVESTYGGKTHQEIGATKDFLENVVENTAKKKGALLIPAFALERTQEMLFDFNFLVEQGRIPKLPIFVDSPLAIKLTAIYQKYSQDPDYFSEEAIKIIKSGDAIFNFPGLKMCLTGEESKEAQKEPPPKVVIAGAGMFQGGRVIYHGKRYLPDPNSTLLFVGFQANGSPGRAILDGAKNINIEGENIPVRAKVVSIAGYSAHADQPQLLRWLSPMRFSAKKIFVVQGEEDQAAALAGKIIDELAVDAEVPSLGDKKVL